MKFVSPQVRHLAVQVYAFLLLREVRWIASWLLALICLGAAGCTAYRMYDIVERRDGNWGHATIDFGGQWANARMLVTGNGTRLYDRLRQRDILEAAYPRSDEDPDAKESDAEKLLSWFMGSDEKPTACVAGHVATLAGGSTLETTALLVADTETALPFRPARGGPLYPPVHALLFGPLGLASPHVAYRLMQAFTLGLTIYAGLLAQRISGGHFWWPLAMVTLLAFPGYNGALDLGQNPLLTLCLLLAGWRLLQCGQPTWAGFIWGFLAFKPVWAVAFLMAPLLAGHWRMAVSMMITGAVLVLITMPLVGLQSWIDWLGIGQEASGVYAACRSWIILSRDLLSIPRRYLLTFNTGWSDADDPHASLATALGIALWIVPFATTVAFALARRQTFGRALEGAPAAFLLLGCWLSCYHFMYYDSLLAAFPTLLLFAEPIRLVHRIVQGEDRRSRAVLWHLMPTVLIALAVALPIVGPKCRPDWDFPPFDTLCFAGLWIWSGRAAVLHSRCVPQATQGGTDVVTAHERLTDEDRTYAARA